MTTSIQTIFRSSVRLGIAVVALAMLLSSCAVGPQPVTAADRAWYAIFTDVQGAGGTCEEQTLAFRDRIHDELHIPYSRMRLVRSQLWSNGQYHLRLQVWMRWASGWVTFDPANDGFNWPEVAGEDYWEHDTKCVFPGDYRLAGARPSDFPQGSE